VGAAALPLQPRRTVRVQLTAYRIRRAHRQLRLGTLKKERILESRFFAKIIRTMPTKIGKIVYMYFIE
jgi:hypothetical protein